MTSLNAVSDEDIRAVTYALREASHAVLLLRTRVLHEDITTSQLHEKLGDVKKDIEVLMARVARL